MGASLALPSAASAHVRVVVTDVSSFFSDTPFPSQKYLHFYVKNPNF